MPKNNASKKSPSEKRRSLGKKWPALLESGRCHPTLWFRGEVKAIGKEARRGLRSTAVDRRSRVHANAE